MSRPARASMGRAMREDVGHGSLASLIDWGELRLRGWDPDRRVFAPHAEDPVFGFARCATASCEQMVHHLGLGLCRRCQQRWTDSAPATSFEKFCLTASARTRPEGGGLCVVCRTPGHERPV